MSIGNFKETSEGNGNNESRMENSEKKGEQKAESTEKRNENVDSKMDEHESKQEKQSEDKENKKDTSDDSQKQSPWDKFKAFLKKEGGDNKGEKEEKAENTKEETPAKTEKKSWELSPEQMEQYDKDYKQVLDDYNSGKLDKKNKPTEDEGKGQREQELDGR